MDKISLCLLTIDRYQMTKFCLDDLLAKTGIDNKNIELLILDNGSKDKRIIEYGKSVANIHISEQTNIGVSAGFNKLFRVATGDFIVTIGNDITLTQNWLKDLIYYNGKIKNSGVSAIYCLLDKGLYNKNLDVFMPNNGLVYGVALWNRNLLNKIGGFDESLKGYGCEDSQYCFRANKTGHINYYIPKQFSVHLGVDFNTESTYRKQKDEDLKNNLQVLKKSIEKMNKLNNYKIKL
jgi:GT2 family glycosyltransferase